MIQILTIKLRLKDKHATELKRQARIVNFVWNYCNETQKKAVQADRKWLNYYDLCKLTAGASKELNICSQTIQQVCGIYNQSRSVSKKSWLRWRTSRSLGWVPFSTNYVKFDGSTFTFRKIKYQTMHLNPKLKPGIKIGVGSFNQDSRGRWYLNLSIQVECAAEAVQDKIGIDLGLKHLATLSDGRKIEAPQFYRKSEAKLATAQRAKKSKRVRNIHAKIANRRKDFLHKESTKLAKEYGLIVIGDVSSLKLAQTGMAKSVMDAGWSDFKRMIEYKSHLRAGRVLEVSEYLTTQTCSTCGTLPSSRPKGIAGLGIREWTCSDCGTVHDRDTNAAKNILRSRLATLVAGNTIFKLYSSRY
jgi:putative transposase